MQESMENLSAPFKRGKVKDVYEIGHDQLLFIFTDRVSAYDVVLPSTIPRKGEILAKLAAFWFNNLNTPHHMVRFEDTNRMIVRRLKMIPVEAVVRGYLYGSLYERLTKGEISIPVEPILASKLQEPYFDPTTKSDVKDEPVTMEQIEEEGWLDSDQLEVVRKKTVEIYNKISVRAEKAGFILADLKLEFGFDKQENIVLADSIGPDEFRLWLRLDLMSSDYGRRRTTHPGRRRRVMTSSRSGTGLERSATRRRLTKRGKRDGPRLAHQTFQQTLFRRRVGGTLSRMSV